MVATVSAIYGLGDPTDYRRLMVALSVDEELTRDSVLQELVGMQYSRNECGLESGKFRVRVYTLALLQH